MKKTVIAMAVAAVMPVAAQADITLSGSVSAEYTLGSNLVPTTEAKLTAESSEVLTNGMTATATFNVLGDKGQGTIGLEGDFGKVMAGTCAKTLEDVADSAPNTDKAKAKTNDEDACLNGVSYTGEMAGFTVNASKGQFDEDARDDKQIVKKFQSSDVSVAAAGAPNVDVAVHNGFDNKEIMEYTTYGAEYDFNGLKVSGQSTTEGTGDAVTKFGAEYAFGDLTVSGSKSSGKDAVVKAAFEQTMGDLAVEVSASSDDAWELEAVYTMGDISITAEDGSKVEETKISAKYAYNDLSIEVDSASKVTVGYDLGNADLSMVREKDKGTKVKYTVSF
jgi:hypothetical protein